MRVTAIDKLVHQLILLFHSNLHTSIHTHSHFMAIMQYADYLMFAGIPSSKLEDSLRAEFYCLHALADGN